MSARPLPRNTILVGDARLRLAELPMHSVDTVITSPPYIQLRNYGMPDQMGLEESVEAWVEELRIVAKGIARVLKPTGSWWLNLGDSYSRQARMGGPPKSLLLAPERLAIALVEDGWILRNKLVWAKTNAMPSPVKDRLSSSWEVVYLLVRSPRYHFDLDSIRVPHRHRGQSIKAQPSRHRPVTATRPDWAGPGAGSNGGLSALKARGVPGHPLGANPRDVWKIATSSFRSEHHATFPVHLVTPMVIAGCPERTCTRCGKPWERSPTRAIGALAVRGDLHPSCTCRKGWQPGVVLDPFFGAGTVGLAAERHGRDWLGVELNAGFAAIASNRIRSARPASGEGTAVEQAS